MCVVRGITEIQIPFTMATTKRITDVPSSDNVNIPKVFDELEKSKEIKCCKGLVKVRKRKYEFVQKEKPLQVKSRATFHMDAIASTAMGIVSSLAGPLIDTGLQTLGKSVKKTFGMSHDSPSIAKADAENFAVCDFPRETISLGFKAADFIGDHGQHFSADMTKDPADLLARCQVPSRILRAQWDKSNVVGDELMATARLTLGLSGPLDVSPAVPAQIVYTGTGAARTATAFHTMLSALSLQYARWRGSLKYTIEVLPTNFHQGQLFIAFQPFLNGSTVTPDLSSSRNCLSAVIDLSVSNRTELTIPFNSDQDYLFLNQTVPLSTQSRNYALGYLSMFVQNPLTGNDVVSSTIDINVWISAGDDFEYAVPREMAVQIWLDGAWQSEGYKEVLVDSRVDAPKVEPNAGLISNTESQVSVNCNVPSADTESIAGREYLLTTGITWTTSQVASTVINTFDIAQLFGQSALSMTGLFTYHNYFHGDFEITLKMNSQPFVTGMLAVYATPAHFTIPNAAFVNSYTPTINQFPCAFFTPFTDTSVTLRIPWTNIARVIRSDEFLTPANALGQLSIVVYNQMRVGTAGTSQLTGSLVGRIIQPYFGVKRANPSFSSSIVTAEKLNVRYQMEMVQDMKQEGVTMNKIGGSQNNTPGVGSSDTQKGEATQSRLAPLLKTPQLGYIRTRHMNAYELMRRPELIAARTIGFNSTESFGQRRMRIPVGCVSVEAGQRAISYLQSMYYSWSGTRRYHIVTNINSYNNITLNTVIDYDALNVQFVDKTNVQNYTPNVRRGLAVFKPNLETVKIISVPYYAIYPVLRTATWANAANAFERINGTLDVGTTYGTAVTAAGDFLAVMYIYASIGDDFNLYHPIAAGATLQPAPTTLAGKQQSEFIKDLTTEGIEPNPGPGDTMDQECDVFESCDETVELTPEDRNAFQRMYQALAKGPAGLKQTLTLCMDYVSNNGAQFVIDKAVNTVKPTLDAQIEGIESRAHALISEKVDLFTRELKVTLSGEFKEVKDGITEACGKLMGAAKDLVVDKIMPVISWILNFITNLYTLFTSEGFFKKIAFAALAAQCATVYGHGTTLLSELNKVVSVEYQSEGMLDYGFLSASVATVVVAGAVTMLGSKFLVTDAKNIRDLTLWKMCESAVAMSKLNSGLKALPELWNLCKKSIESAISYFVDGKTLYDNWYQENLEKIKEWTKQTEGEFVANHYDNNNLFKTRDGILNYTTLEEHAKFAAEINVHGPHIKFFPQTTLRLANKVLETMSGARKAYDYVSGRTEPVGILVQGEAGAGKSYAWANFFPYLIMKKVGLIETFEDAQRQTYAKPPDPEQKFFDGYMSQRWVMVDDFLAGTEDKDALEMISLISVATCPLNMADLTSKKTLFDSNFVCATTNQASVAVANAIRDKSALVRRFPFSYGMLPKQAFLSGGKFNMGQFEKDFGGVKTVEDLMDIMERAWEIQRLDLSTGGKSGKATVREVIDEIAACYLKRTGVDSRIQKIMGSLQGPFDKVKDFLVRGKDRLSVKWEQFLRKETRIMLDLRPYVDRDVIDCDDNLVQDLMSDVEEIYDEKGVIDYVTAQLVLKKIQEDTFDYGYVDWHHLSSVAKRFKADVTTPRLFSRINKYSFPRFVAFLASIQPTAESKSIWPGIAKFLAITAGVVGVVYLVKELVNKYLLSSLDGMMQGPQYDSNGNRQPFHKVRTGKIVAKRAFAIQQSDLPTEHPKMQEWELSVRKSLRRIEMRGTKIEPAGLFCMALDNKTLLVPAHFLNEFKKRNVEGDLSLWLETKSRDGERVGFTPVRIDATNSQKLLEQGIFEGKRDCVVVRLIGVTCQNARNIRGLLMTRDDFSKRAGSIYQGMWVKKEEIVRSVFNFDMPVQDLQEDYYIAAKIVGQSKVGDCGQVYIMRNTSLSRPIVGFHSVYFEQQDLVGVTTFSIEAVREAEAVIDDRCRLLPAIEGIEVERVSSNSKQAEFVRDFWPERVECIGAGVFNGEPLVTYNPTDTQLCKTGLKHAAWIDEFVPTQKKALVVGSNRVHPLFSNLSKFENTATQAVPIIIHERAVEYICGRIGKGENTRLLTNDEIINGTATLGPLVLSTSCGFIQKYFRNGKEQLFEEIEQVDGEKKKYKLSQKAYNQVIPVFGQSFVDHLNEQEDRIANAKAPVTFFCAVNKDELTTVAKQQMGKTRVFLASGLELTFLIRKYFGAFLEYYYENMGFNIMSAIGCDKDTHWKDFYEGLVEVGGNGFDVDYTNYDGSVPEAAVECFLHVVQNYYQDEYFVHRCAIFHVIVHSIVVAGEMVFAKEVGIPSGIVATEVTNTVENFYLMLVAFQISQLMNGMPVDMGQFDRVRGLAYGDDVIIGAPDEVLEYFNRKTVKEVLGELGMVVTAADKSAEIIASEPIDNLSFLKSNFSQRNGYMASPLPKRVIHRELIWGKKANQGDATIMKQKVDVACRMAAHHGREECELLMDQLRQLGVHCTFNFNMWEIEMRDKQELSRLRQWKWEPEMYCLKDSSDPRLTQDWWKESE